MSASMGLRALTRCWTCISRPWRAVKRVFQSVDPSWSYRARDLMLWRAVKQMFWNVDLSGGLGMLSIECFGALAHREVVARHRREREGEEKAHLLKLAFLRQVWKSNPKGGKWRYFFLFFLFSYLSVVLVVNRESLIVRLLWHLISRYNWKESIMVWAVKETCSW